MYSNYVYVLTPCGVQHVICYCKYKFMNTHITLE